MSCVTQHYQMQVLEMRFLWALGTGKTLRRRMGLDLGCKKWWGLLDRVVGKGILGRKECSSKCTEIKNNLEFVWEKVWASTAGKSHGGWLDSGCRVGGLQEIC